MLSVLTYSQSGGQKLLSREHTKNIWLPKSVEEEDIFVKYMIVFYTFHSPFHMYA